MPNFSEQQVKLLHNIMIDFSCQMNKSKCIFFGNSFVVKVARQLFRKKWFCENSTFFNQTPGNLKYSIIFCVYVNLKRFAIVFLFAFAYNTKRFATAFLFFLFHFLVSAFRRIGKSYFQIFVQLLLWVRATWIGVINMICCVLWTKLL